MDRRRGHCVDHVFAHNPYRQWRSLRFLTRRSKMYIPKNFYKTRGSKSCIPKKNYTKTTYSPLMSEKFGGAAAPSRPIEAAPLLTDNAPREPSAPFWA
ncbi:hypothetical protein Hanom_Chr07g00656721 [Helianthus anomalus]